MIQTLLMINNNSGPLALTDVAVSAVLIFVIAILLALFIYQGTQIHLVLLSSNGCTDRLLLNFGLWLVDSLDE
jgi:hypothetical protein